MENNNEKYANGKIYRISCNITGLCYVGSTCETLSHRLSKHAQDYRNYLKGNYHYITSFEIIKNDDYQITLLQAYPCENNRELLDREGWYQKKYWDRSVNRTQNGRTKEQYYQDHKHENNKSFQCECGKLYTFQHKKRHEKSTKHQNWLNE